MKNKILILAYDFPPYISVAGYRPFSWYKHFHEHGIYPVVVTRQWENKYGNHLDFVAPGYSKKTLIEETERGTIIKTPYMSNLANRMLLKYGEKKFRFFRKFITAWHEFFQWFFFTGTKSGLYYGAREYLKTHHVDAIIATGGPFVLFRYASVLSRKHHIPWIADYRDPWVNGVIIKNKYSFSVMMKYLERKICRKAEYITTVSDYVKGNIYKNIQNGKFKIIPNGYDHDITYKSNGKQTYEKLTISFAGSLQSYHPVEVFLSVLGKFINETKLNCQLNFYGINDESRILNYIALENPKLIKYVNVYPKIPYSDLIEKLSASNILLLFNDYVVMGTKIYDYLGLKRKILFCFANDSDAEFLRKQKYIAKTEDVYKFQMQKELILKTKSGIVVENQKHLYEVLNELHREFLTAGYIECLSVDTEKYDRKFQVSDFAELFYKVANKS